MPSRISSVSNRSASYDIMNFVMNTVILTFRCFTCLCTFSTLFFYVFITFFFNFSSTYSLIKRKCSIVELLSLCRVNREARRQTSDQRGPATDNYKYVTRRHQQPQYDIIERHAAGPVNGSGPAAAADCEALSTHTPKQQHHYEVTSERHQPALSSDQQLT